MQAIILAAGMGRRLGELTQNNTKCMVSVNGTRLIDRLLTQLSRLNLQRVVIVIGYKGDLLRQYIGNRYRGQLHIEFVENPVFDKTNNIYSLALAGKQLQEDDTLLIESDLIFDEAMFDLILNNPYPNLALVAKYQTWMDGTMVCIDNDNNIINFVPKKAFNYADTDHYYKTVNIYKFSRDFSCQKYMPFLEAYCKSLGNNEYYEQVLRVITFLDKSELKALPVNNLNWYEIDDIQDLDIASAIFSDCKTKTEQYMRRFGGYWRFPDMIDFCYLVNPHFPSPRMKDELRANFDTLLTEYPSGMQVNALLAGKCFGLKQDYVVPGNGAAELIKSLITFIGKEQKVGVIRPTFEEYPNRLNCNQVIAFETHAPNFSYDTDTLIQFFDTKNINYLLLINPDNPSGNFISRPDVLRLAEWCYDKNIRLIVDESFVDFSTGYTENSLLSNTILETYPSLIVMKSISKSFGVPGLRLGILASADKQLVNTIKNDVSIWNINSFAEFYMQIYSKYEADFGLACEKFQSDRQQFLDALNTISFLRVIPSEANYFLCEVLSPFTSVKLVDTLLTKYNILVKDCSTKKGFLGKDYIRIAIRNHTDNAYLVKALNNIDQREN